MSLASAQKLVAGITQVASLPEIYFKIEAALEDPKTSNQNIADILSEDSALTARMLRLANSSFFNFPGKIENISQTITIIGIRQLREVVLASSVVNVFKDVPEDLIDMRSFWRHSIGCGVACRAMASLRRETNIETAFVTGLLHDIGRLILYKYRAKDMKEIIEKCRKYNTLLYVAEKQHFGYDHADVGAFLLKEWRLPSRIIETTFSHHRPSRAKTYISESALVHVGNILASALQMGSSGERFVPPLAENAWQQLGLEPDSIELIISEMDKQYSVAVDLILGMPDEQ